MEKCLRAVLDLDSGGTQSRVRGLCLTVVVGEMYRAKFLGSVCVFRGKYSRVRELCLTVNLGEIRTVFESSVSLSLKGKLELCSRAVFDWF